MKVRAILEFDLEDETGGPITDRREYAWAADITRNAIRSRMMGDGFLPDDAIIGTYAVNVRVIDTTMDNLDPDEVMERHGGVWGEHPDHPVQSWIGEVAAGDTRSGYWRWVAARAGAD